MTGPKKLLAVCAGLALVLGLVALLSLLVGSARVAPGAIVDLVMGRGPVEGTERVVILGIRLPRIAAAALAGGALAVAGAGFQALTRNPLAEPSILGVSAGAAFGVVLAQISGLGQGLVEALGLTAFAFAGALVAGVSVYVIAATGRGLPVHTLLLAGVIVGIFFSAAITVLISLVDTNRLGGVIHWLLGNLAPIPAGALGVFAAVTALGVWLVLGKARALNLLALGEEGAQELGVDAERLKRRMAPTTACSSPRPSWAAASSCLPPIPWRGRWSPPPSSRSASSRPSAGRRSSSTSCARARDGSCRDAPRPA